MGLDQYLYKYDPKLEQNKVSNTTEERKHEAFHYWRKHPAIHDWMERIWISKNRTLPEWHYMDTACDDVSSDTPFNLIPLELTVRDLVTLSYAIANNELNYSASGFFFGRSRNPSDDDFSDQKARDLDAIRKAIDAIADGFVVYYDSCW